MKPITLLSLGLLAAAVFLFAACGSVREAPPTAETERTATQQTPAGVSTTEPPAASGDGSGTGTGGLASRGKEIFAESFCATCHTVEGLTTGRIGPDLTHIGTDGASRKPGFSAEEYIFESIRDPEAFVAQGVERAFPGTMTKDITDEYSDDEVSALVAFLASQK